MKKIQHTKFSSIGEFLDFIPEAELKIVETLRELILESLSPVVEKLAYNVPFYYGNSRTCYIWPASIPWGGIKKGVAIGFCRGNLLSDEHGYLEKRDRKEVFTKTFTSVEEIEPDLLRSYLFEAKEIDNLLSRK